MGLAAAAGCRFAREKAEAGEWRTVVRVRERCSYAKQGESEPSNE